MSAALAMDFGIQAHTNATSPQATAVVDVETFLVRRLRAGDQRAYAALVDANGARMLATARRILASDDDARDAVQEAWIHAIRALDRFAGQARLSTWLHRIVVNAALMKLRSQRRRPVVPLDELPAQADAEGAWTGAGDRTSADESIAARERRALVRRSIDLLSEDYRRVILLRDFEELDTEETAHRLGITAGAVKTRLHRAHHALRAVIEQQHAAAGDRFPVAIQELAA